MNTFEGNKIPKGIEIYEVTEPVSFGALQRYNTTMRLIGENPKGRIIILRNVPHIDSFEFFLFKVFCERCYRDRIKLVLVATHPQPLSLMKKEGLYDLIGPQNIVDTVPQALKCLQKIG